MKSVKEIKIDAQKLKRELEKRGLTQAEVSREMGYSGNFLSKHVIGGHTTKTVAVLLERLYNIPLDAYKADEPESEQEPQEEQLAGQMTFSLPSMTKDELWEVICTAQYEAMKNLLHELGINRAAADIAEIKEALR